MAINCWFRQDVERIIAQAHDAIVADDGSERDEGRLEALYNIAVGFGLARPHGRVPNSTIVWENLKTHAERDHGL